ncbi:hypothetical protein Ciccas_007582 [Cichlidogyrus casuarinus]|uniref:Coatomer subunit epsilon n=1 Tax=Cichlidogyrus casuarinus TaxID=1844966 RepID=A0ABD2Q2J0_9PLAT
MNDEDRFSDAFSSYLLNNYQNSLKHLHQIQTKNSQLKKKCDILMYRIYIGQKKYGVVMNEIPQSSTDPVLQLVRLLAQANAKPNKQVILDEIKSLLSGNISPDDSDILILAGAIYSHFEEYELALKVLRLGNGLLCDAMTVQVLININRYDLALKLVSRMLIADEDSLITQIASATCYIAQGGDKLPEALSVFQELQEKYGQNVFILNGQAAALIGMEKWEDAELKLKESLDIDPNNVDTLINMLFVSHHLNQPFETVTRYLNQIKDSDASHHFIANLDSKSEEFKRSAELYSAEVIA